MWSHLAHSLFEEDFAVATTFRTGRLSPPRWVSMLLRCLLLGAADVLPCTSHLSSWFLPARLAHSSSTLEKGTPCALSLKLGSTEWWCPQPYGEQCSHPFFHKYFPNTGPLPHDACLGLTPWWSPLACTCTRFL